MEKKRIREDNKKVYLFIYLIFAVYAGIIAYVNIMNTQNMALLYTLFGISCALVVGTIERNAIECDKFGVLIKGTKTNRSRTISIPDVLVEQLLKYRKWQESWIEELGDYYNNSDQVFSHPDGSRVTTATYNKWFKKVRDKADLPESFTLYNLRHTNISILVGYVPITTVAQRAGHSTIKTTEEYYIHRVSEADIKGSEKLNSVFEKAYQNQDRGEAEQEISEYKEALEKMKLLGFKTLQEYFEYLNYMKSKGYIY